MTSDSRQRALSALASIQALTPNERKGMLGIKQQVNTRVLSRNLLAFFEASMLSDDGVPNFTMQEFTDSLANALLQFGENANVGVAVLQTLVHELQDRVNSKLSGN
jgi:hypothetical protein